MAIMVRYYLSDLVHKDTPMPHHKLGLSWTRSGYGKKIPSRTMVKLPGSKRWRRVYVCIYSNTGTSYVPVPGGWAVIVG